VDALTVKARKASASFFEKKGAPPGEAKKLSLNGGHGALLPTPAGPKVFCFPGRGAFFSKKKLFLA